jgi:ferredoxin-NADP reductase
MPSFEFFSIVVLYEFTSELNRLRVGDSLLVESERWAFSPSTVFQTVATWLLASGTGLAPLSILQARCGFDRVKQVQRASASELPSAADSGVDAAGAGIRRALCLPADGHP